MRREKLTNKGFSLIEILIVIALAAIPALAVGILLSASARSWNQIYARANSKIKQDSLAFMTSVQSYGRQANQTNYKVYRVQAGQFIEAVPAAGSQVAKGQALELRYWQENFDPQSADGTTLEFSNTGTHYALYYLDGDEMKVDFGRVVGGVGAVNNGVRQTANILSTQTLADRVNTSESADIFSHTVSGGSGSGCVNASMKLTDAQGVSVEIEMASLLRSTWPR
jgi:prepilin-type N-terminal cleavage/methylation domain-containing protein